jgi:regulator of replication initiation timing
VQQLQVQADEGKDKVTLLTNENQRLGLENDKLEAKVMELGDRLGDSQIVKGAYDSLKGKKDSLEAREK